jgi:two-component system sensor kinase FixL
VIWGKSSGGVEKLESVFVRSISLASMVLTTLAVAVLMVTLLVVQSGNNAMSTMTDGVMVWTALALSAMSVVLLAYQIIFGTRARDRVAAGEQGGSGRRRGESDARGDRSWAREVPPTRTKASMEPGAGAVVEAKPEATTGLGPRSSVVVTTEAELRLAQACIDGLRAHVAILDGHGTIVSVNEAWRDFVRQGGGDETACGIGANYLATCERATGDCAIEAGQVADSLLSLIEGRVESVYHRYPCHSPTKHYWFQMRATRFGPLDDLDRLRIVVSHENVTEVKEAEELIHVQSQQVAHAARLTLMGEMAAGLAHEINQPLGAIAAYARGCLRRLRVVGRAHDPELIEAIEAVAQEAERAGEIVRRMRAFARKPKGREDDVDLREVLEEVMPLAETDARRRGAAIDLSIPGEQVPVRIDSVQVQQVVLNLLRNAVDAATSVEGVPARVRIAILTADGVAEIRVSDSGPSVSPDVAQRLFEPFFTTKPDGTGLGLIISKSIVDRHGGRLWAVPSDGGGLEFRVELPMLKPATMTAS